MSNQHTYPRYALRGRYSMPRCIAGDHRLDRPAGPNHHLATCDGTYPIAPFANGTLTLSVTP